MRHFLSKLTHPLRRRRFEHDLEDEIRGHLETRIDELMAAGMTQSDAAAQARREFGRDTRIREESREAWTFRWIEDLYSDLRYAARTLRRSPLVALAAIVSLALGIGANTTIFSLTVEFLFSHPSVTSPESLAAVRLGGNSHAEQSNIRLLKEAGLFAGVTGYYEEGEVNWHQGSDTFRLQPMFVADNFFDVTGVPVAMGRGIRTDERDVTVLSNRFWQHRLGGDPEILGRVLSLDGRPHVVVGVLPPDHRTVLGYGFAPDLYLPVSNPAAVLAIIVRTNPADSHSVVIQKLLAFSRELDRVHPSGYGSYVDGTEANSLVGLDRMGGGAALSIAAFFGLIMVVAGLVLAIACANVSSLLLARAASRRHELAVRLAIGAGRVRLIRQFLAESFLLAFLGTIAGLALDVSLTKWISGFPLSLPIPIQLHIAPDWRLLLYGACIAMGCSLAAGLLPALRSTAVAQGLKMDARQITGSFRRFPLQSWLVAGQLAVSVLLLTAGFLFVRNLLLSRDMKVGFDLDHTIWAKVSLVPEHYASDERVRAVIGSALEILRGTPGVAAASTSRNVPLNASTHNTESVQTDRGESPIRVQFFLNLSAPDYFSAMGIPMVQGREFLPSDRGGAPRVTILNESFRRRIFGNVNPIGRQLVFITPQGRIAMEIVGVARDSKYFTLGELDAPALYRPLEQAGRLPRELNFMIRAQDFPGPLVNGIRTKLSALDESAAVEVKTMRNSLTLALLPSRVGAAMFASIGALGLLLASVGLYGVLAYTVSRRTREIGVRIALGASQGRVLRMVLRDSGILVGTGLAIGLAISFFAIRPLAAFLVPDLRPADTLSFAGTVITLGVIGLIASAAPAWKAIRVDPVTALRSE